MSKPFDPDAPAAPGSGIYGLATLPSDAAVILIPMPWEPTTSYRKGTARGPAAIFEASAQVDLFDLETGRPYAAGIAMLDEEPQIQRWNLEATALAERVIDAGGVAGSDELAAVARQVDELSVRANDWLAAETRRWLAGGKLVGVVGGDHASPFGAIAAIAEKHPGMGVLHLDAHADLRDAYEGFTWSHASIMHNVVNKIAGVGRLVQVGIRDFGEAEHKMIRESKKRIVTFFDAELARHRLAGEETWGAQCARIVAELPSEVYLSWDIDGLDPVLCPHTGTPVPGGLSFHEACLLLRTVVESGKKIVGLDLNEVAPGEDGDEWDGNVGARLLYKMIGWALKSRG